MQTISLDHVVSYPKRSGYEKLGPHRFRHPSSVEIEIPAGESWDVGVIARLIADHEGGSRLDVIDDLLDGTR